jgi:hypothetical protein
MSRKSKKNIANDANRCITFLKYKGGQARLSELSVSLYIIQDLVNKGQIKVKNTGMGYCLELQGQS